MLPYKAVFYRQAWEFAVRAKDEELGEIAHWVNRIERTPAARGDYTEWDDDGRELQVMALDRVVVTYWTDDAVREVRVVRIESLRSSR
jgi:hypothetical protein